MTKAVITRRDTVALLSALAGLGGGFGPGSGRLLSQALAAEPAMPKRGIPSTREMIPVVGLGSTKAVSEIPAEGTEPLEEVLRTLVAHGGSVVDTWPRDAANDAEFGRVISAPDLRESLFVILKIDRPGKEAGLAQFHETQRLYQGPTTDLLQIFNLTDLETHWPTLQELKATGETRYIGVTVSNYNLYEDLKRFMMRESPDLVQMNYSVTERRAEEQLLPLAAEKGIGVVINRPFMNGSYFRQLEGHALPGWAAEFDCTSWAQFSLKYILANQHLTCVLTETTNPRHMAENALASIGRMPDEAARTRMRMFIDQI